MFTYLSSAGRCGSFRTSLQTRRGVRMVEAMEMRSNPPPAPRGVGIAIGLVGR